MGSQSEFIIMLSYILPTSVGNLIIVTWLAYMNVNCLIKVYNTRQTTYYHTTEVQCNFEDNPHIEHESGF